MPAGPAAGLSASQSRPRPFGNATRARYLNARRDWPRISPHAGPCAAIRSDSGASSAIASRCARRGGRARPARRAALPVAQAHRLRPLAGAVRHDRAVVTLRRNSSEAVSMASARPSQCAKARLADQSCQASKRPPPSRLLSAPSDSRTPPGASRPFTMPDAHAESFAYLNMSMYDWRRRREPLSTS